MKLLSNADNGDVSFFGWDMTFEMKGTGSTGFVQVAVRRWKQGRIVHETFLSQVIATKYTWLHYDLRF